MFYRQIMETRQKAERTRNPDGEGNAAARNVETNVQTEKLEEAVKETEEPIAGPSREIQGEMTDYYYSSEKTVASEDVNASMRSIPPTDDQGPNQELMETPGEYISISDETEQEMDIVSKRKKYIKNARNTNSSNKKNKAKRRLYDESEEEMDENRGIDTPLLLLMNEMSANDVAAKAFI